MEIDLPTFADRRGLRASVLQPARPRIAFPLILSLVSWGARFDDPIALANGPKLLTLQDAATHITNLPKKESDLPEWQAAIEALMHVADRGGPGSA
jgi:hypothetical protein